MVIAISSASRTRPRPDLPVFKRQPLGPAPVGGLELFGLDVAEWHHEGHGLVFVHVVLAFGGTPPAVLGRKGIVASLALVQRADAGGPSVAEEAVEDRRLVKGCDDQPADVWDETDDGVRVG